MTSLMYGTEPECDDDINSFRLLYIQQDQDQEEEELTEEDYSYWCGEYWQNFANHDDDCRVRDEKVAEHDTKEPVSSKGLGNDQSQDNEPQDGPSAASTSANETDNGDKTVKTDTSSLGGSVADFLSAIVSKKDSEDDMKSFCSWEISHSSERGQFDETKKTDDISKREEVEAVSSLSSFSMISSSQESTVTLTLHEETSTEMNNHEEESFPRTIWCYADTDNGDDQLNYNEDNKNWQDNDTIPSSGEHDHVQDTAKNGSDDASEHQANDPVCTATEILPYTQHHFENNDTFANDDGPEQTAIVNHDVVTLEGGSPAPAPLPSPPPVYYANKEATDETLEVVAVSEDESIQSQRQNMYDAADHIDKESPPAPIAGTNNSAQGSLRIQRFQNEKWMCRYKALVKYREKHGNCNVPFQAVSKKQEQQVGQNKEKEDDPILSQWVKRQRHQYKLRSSGKRSHLTDDRVQLLEDIGFIWDSHAAAWEENYEALRAFRYRHGHCHVPIAEPRLSTWMKRQRRQYKLFVVGKSSTMTQGRVDKLNNLGFVWYGTAAPSDVNNR